MNVTENEIQEWYDELVKVFGDDINFDETFVDEIAYVYMLALDMAEQHKKNKNPWNLFFDTYNDKEWFNILKDKNNATLRTKQELWENETIEKVRAAVEEGKRRPPNDGAKKNLSEKEQLARKERLAREKLYEAYQKFIESEEAYNSKFNATSDIRRKTAMPFITGYRRTQAVAKEMRSINDKQRKKLETARENMIRAAEAEGVADTELNQAIRDARQAEATEEGQHFVGGKKRKTKQKHKKAKKRTLRKNNISKKIKNRKNKKSKKRR